MTRIERSIIIPAPVEDVFSYAADYRTWATWFDGASDVRASAAIAQGNGARYAYRVRMMGVSASVETEVHDFVVNSGWRGVATRGVPHETSWICREVEEGTSLTYSLEYRLPVPLLGSIVESLLMRPQWERFIEKR
jgi:uncharacterized protein YndB with AHSA1/START domain